MSLNESLKPEAPSKILRGRKPKYVAKFKALVGALVALGVIELIGSLVVWFMHRGNSYQLLNDKTMSAEALLFVGIVPILIALPIIIISAIRHKFLYAGGYIYGGKKIAVAAANKEFNRNWRDYFVEKYRDSHRRSCENPYVGAYYWEGEAALEASLALAVKKSGFLRCCTVFLSYTLFLNIMVCAVMYGYGNLLKPLVSLWFSLEAIFPLNIPMLVSFLMLAGGIFFLWPERYKGFWKKLIGMISFSSKGEICISLAIILILLGFPFGMILLVSGLFLHLFSLTCYLRSYEDYVDAFLLHKYKIYIPWEGILLKVGDADRFIFDPCAYTIEDYEKFKKMATYGWAAIEI